MGLDAYLEMLMSSTMMFFKRVAKHSL